MIGAILLMGLAAISAELAERRMRDGSAQTPLLLILVGAAGMRALVLALQTISAP